MERSKRTVAWLLCLVFIALWPLAAFAEGTGEGQDTQAQPEATTRTFEVEQGGVLYVDNPVGTDRLNLRQEASSNSTSLGRYYTGTVVEVLNAGPEFTQVRVGNQMGYMQNNYLTETRQAMENYSSWAAVRIRKVGEKLNLRASTEEGAISLGLFPIGTAVQILEDSGDFYKVRTLEAEGYMHKQYIVLDGAVGRMPNAQLTTGQVTTEFLQLRSFPSRKAPSLGEYPAGTKVKILSMSGTWFYVEIIGETGHPLENQRGFMLMQYVHAGNYREGGGSPAQPYALVVSNDETMIYVMRTEPAWNSEIIDIFVNGSQVEVLDDIPAGTEVMPTWVHIRVDGVEGYLQGEYLRLVDRTDPATWALPENVGIGETTDETGESLTPDPDATASPEPSAGTDPSASPDASASPSASAPPAEGGTQPPLVLGGGGSGDG